jgi:hypothetical protein
MYMPRSHPALCGLSTAFPQAAPSAGTRRKPASLFRFPSARRYRLTAMLAVNRLTRSRRRFSLLLGMLYGQITKPPSFNAKQQANITYIVGQCCQQNFGMTVKYEFEHSDLSVHRQIAQQQAEAKKYLKCW